MEQTVASGEEVLRKILEQCVHDCLRFGKTALMMGRFRAAQKAWERAWHDTKGTMVCFGAIEEIKIGESSE